MVLGKKRPRPASGFGRRRDCLPRLGRAPGERHTVFPGKQNQPAACIPSPLLRILTMFSKKTTGGIENESNWDRAAHRRPGPGGHPQGDPPHHAHPGGRPVTDDMDMVGDVLLWNAGSGKKNRPGLYIMTKPAGSTVGIREGSCTRKIGNRSKSSPRWPVANGGCRLVLLLTRSHIPHRNA